MCDKSKKGHIKVIHTFKTGEYDTIIITKYLFIDGEEVASIEELYRWDRILGGLVSIDHPTWVVTGDELGR